MTAGAGATPGPASGPTGPATGAATGPTGPATDTTDATDPSAPAAPPAPAAPTAPPAAPADNADLMYARRVAELTRAIDRLRGRESAVSLARGVAFLAIIATWWVSARTSLSSGAPLFAGAGFLALVAAHHRLAQRREALERIRALYLRGRARLRGDWSDGPRGARYRDERHPYANDLDLFGDGSLFQLLSQARTLAGHDCLARWLMEPAELDELRSRHAAVRELRERPQLREQLAASGPNQLEGIDLARLRRWCEAALVPVPGAGHAAGLAATSLVIAGLFAPALGLPAAPLLVLGGAATLGLLAWAFLRLAPAIAGIHGRAADLDTVAAALAVFERAALSAPALVALQRRLRVDGAPPSVVVARLGRWLSALELQYHQLFLPIALVVLWPLHVGLGLHRWRRTHGRAVAGWIDALGELEALGSLAVFAYEQADATFPELAAPSEGPQLDAEALGHPLLPAGSRVCNDVAFGRAPQILIVTGSNMSGKSTLLRTVGVNVVLALAGAPVIARRLRLSRVQLAATLHVQDSLRAGRSRFYAEILKLRQVLELARAPLPVLFLIDEVFHGTNSHDRQVGGTALICKGLLARGAIGLLSTHDQAFAALGDSHAPEIQNVHFADELVDGALRFDYRLRPGAVQHSNALELMRSIGVEV